MFYNAFPLTHSFTTMFLHWHILSLQCSPTDTFLHYNVLALTCSTMFRHWPVPVCWPRKRHTACLRSDPSSHWWKTPPRQATVIITSQSYRNFSCPQRHHIERQKGLITSRLHTQLDPFASKVIIGACMDSWWKIFSGLIGLKYFNECMKPQKWDVSFRQLYKVPACWAIQNINSGE